MKIITWTLLGALLFAHTAQATILWTGGEDIDFPNGATPTQYGSYRVGYSRMGWGLPTVGTFAISNAFSAGPVTSAWFSVQVYMNTYGPNNKIAGLGKSGTSNGLWIGIGGTTGKIALWKYDGTTWTLLATEVGTSIPNNAMYKYDMQVISYGASATVNIYVNGLAAPKLTFTGDVTVGGNTNLDNVQFTETDSWAGSVVSEFIVADVDTRLMSVVTLAPSAAGTTNLWTGAYTDVNEIVVNDATLISSATSGQNFQSNLTDLPGANFAIKAVKVSVKATQAGGGITGLALGLYTNATVSVPAATSLISTWNNYQTLYQTNPVTSSPFTPTEINALQLNLQSAP